MNLNESIKKHKESSIYEAPVGNELNFRFLEQTKEIISDTHLKTLFETGDRPNGVDFELLINSKVHQDDFNSSNVAIQDSITNLEEEMSFNLDTHISDIECHLTSDEKLDVGKIPSLETTINNLNSIIGGVSRQHIVMSIAEMEALADLIHADICHVIDTKETYIYNNEIPLWVKVSDFDSLTSVDWSIIQNVPAEFNPSAHIHSIEDVNGLQEALDFAVGGDLSNYHKKQESIVISPVNPEESTNLAIHRTVEGIEGISSFAVGYTENAPSLVLLLNQDNNLVSRLDLTNSAFRPSTNKTHDLGTLARKWKDGYFDTTWCSTSRFTSDKNSTKFSILNNGSVLAISRANEDGSWLDDFATFDYAKRNTTIKNLLTADKIILNDIAPSSSSVVINTLDGNTYGDSKTHIGHKNADGQYCHLLRGDGYTNISTPTTTVRDFNCTSIKINGKNLSISSTAPSNPAVGDVWISI